MYFKMNGAEKWEKTWKKWLFNLLIAVLVIVGLVLIFNQPIQKMLLQHKTQTYQVQHVTRKKNYSKSKSNDNF